MRLRICNTPRAGITLVLLAVLLTACASAPAQPPPPQPLYERALAQIADGAALKRQINFSAGKAHAEGAITETQLDTVTTAAEAFELALNRARAALRTWMTADVYAEDNAPDDGQVEAALVRVATARAHLEAVAKGFGLKWEVANG